MRKPSLLRFSLLSLLGLLASASLSGLAWAEDVGIHPPEAAAELPPALPCADPTTHLGAPAPEGSDHTAAHACHQAYQPCAAAAASHEANCFREGERKCLDRSRYCWRDCAAKASPARDKCEDKCQEKEEACIAQVEDRCVMAAGERQEACRQQERACQQAVTARDQGDADALGPPRTGEAP